MITHIECFAVFLEKVDYVHCHYPRRVIGNIVSNNKVT